MRTQPQLADRWLVAGVSLRGTSHEKSGAPCQDAWCAALSRTGARIVAVADGAGSAAHSEWGSKAAARAAAEALKASLDSGGLPNTEDACRVVLLQAAETALSELRRVSAERQVALRDLACTLLLVVSDRQFTCGLQVGDGAIVHEPAEQAPEALTRPEFGEHVNEVTFLTSAGALSSPQMFFCKGPSAPIAVFSDGLEMVALAMPAGHPVRGFFRPLFAVMGSMGSDQEASSELDAFLSSPRVRERCDDDLTLVVVIPPWHRTAEASEGREKEPAPATRPPKAPQADVAVRASRRTSVPGSSPRAIERPGPQPSRPRGSPPKASPPARQPARTYSVTQLRWALIVGMLAGGLATWAASRVTAPEPGARGMGASRVVHAMGERAARRIDASLVCEMPPGPWLAPETSTAQTRAAAPPPGRKRAPRTQHPSAPEPPGGGKRASP